MLTKVSYEGLTMKEVSRLYRQWLKGKQLYRCELGHDGCGATSEASQDGKAPCSRELVNELAWRNAAVSTVE